MHISRMTIASVASITAIALTVPTSAADFAFIPLGSSVSEVNDVSADGSTIVGTAKGSPIEAFRWSLGEELAGLGNELSVRGTIASAISGDGTVVSGSILEDYPSLSAFLWTEPSGMQRIKGGNGISIGTATALSFDGKVAVGQMAIANVNNGFAYRWTETTGAVNLGDLPGAMSIARRPTSRPMEQLLLETQELTADMRRLDGQLTKAWCNCRVSRQVSLPVAR